MITMVQIRDYPGSRTYQMIVNPEDLELEKWEVEDPSLTDEVFEGKKTWSELTVIHFMILLSQHCAGLPVDALREARFTTENPFMSRLTDLLCGYIRACQERNGAFVEFLRVSVLEENRVNFDTTMAVSVQIEGVDKPKLRIVK